MNIFSKTLLLSCVYMSFLYCTYAQEETSLDTIVTEQAVKEAFSNYADSIVSTFDKKTGNVIIDDGLAEIDVPKGYYYIGKEDAKKILVDIWGNPIEAIEGTLGVLTKEGEDITSDDAWLVTISYEETGYIEDEDAQSIDYDELLVSMQEEIAEANEARKEMGYGSVKLVGWAVPPYYDKEAKKLHWAKELNFDEAESNTLNYDIRILGRKGVLILKAVGDISILETVRKDVPSILSSVNFEQGNRYIDFNPEIDEVAAYGIGGLILGKALAKGGFFVFLAKFWKFIAFGAIALFGTLRKFIFGGKKEESSESEDESA